MFVFVQSGASLLALTGAVGAIQYIHPRATPVNSQFDASGWTPKPTTKPRPMQELFRRQEDPAFCGYLEGDEELPITCDPGSSCVHEDVYGLFGCCSGSGFAGCDFATACFESAYDYPCSEQSDCADDPLATACSASDQPYCGVLFATLSSEVYFHFVCADVNTTMEVLPSSFVAETTLVHTWRSSTPGDSFSKESANLRSSSSRPVSSDDTETSITPDGNSQSFTDNAATLAQNSPTATNAPSSATPAAAVRTAEAMLGAAGGLAGIFAVLL